MTFIIIIPLAVLVIYLMATVAKFCNAYPEYHQHHPGQQCHGQPAGGCGLQHVPHCHRMRTYQSIHELMEEDRPLRGWEQIKDPHQTISDARKTYRQLLKRTPEGPTDQD